MFKTCSRLLSSPFEQVCSCMTSCARFPRKGENLNPVTTTRLPETKGPTKWLVGGLVKFVSACLLTNTNKLNIQQTSHFPGPVYHGLCEVDILLMPEYSQE